MHRGHEALGATHTCGIVQRDVKPRNLFLLAGEPPPLRLLDFGLARLHAASMALTRTGLVVGTLS